MISIIQPRFSANGTTTKPEKKLGNEDRQKARLLFKSLPMANAFLVIGNGGNTASPEDFRSSTFGTKLIKAVRGLHSRFFNRLRQNQAGIIEKLKSLNTGPITDEMRLDARVYNSALRRINRFAYNGPSNTLLEGQKTEPQKRRHQEQTIDAITQQNTIVRKSLARQALRKGFEIIQRLRTTSGLQENSPADQEHLLHIAKLYANELRLKQAKRLLQALPQHIAKAISDEDILLIAESIKKEVEKGARQTLQEKYTGRIPIQTISNLNPGLTLPDLHNLKSPVFNEVPNEAPKVPALARSKVKTIGPLRDLFNGFLLTDVCNELNAIDYRYKAVEKHLSLSWADDKKRPETLDTVPITIGTGNVSLLSTQTLPEWQNLVNMASPLKRQS